jgi:tetratricopeptide (TPR) repeat protein
MIKKSIFFIFIYFCLASLVLYSAESLNNQPKSKSNNKLTDYKIAEKKIIKAKKLEAKGKTEKSVKLYKEALIYLLSANNIKPADPDTFNYLGFVNRKIGNMENAEIYYLLGLDQEPAHKSINEYLGELYIITERIDLAKERLEVLKNCNCEEYDELKKIIEGTKKSKY